MSEHSAQGRGGARGLVARARIHALVILAGLVARTVNVAVALGSVACNVGIAGVTERAAAVRAVLRHVALGVEAAVARVSAQPFYAGLAEETVCITDTSSLRWNFSALYLGVAVEAGRAGTAHGAPRLGVDDRADGVGAAWLVLLAEVPAGRAGVLIVEADVDGGNLAVVTCHERAEDAAVGVGAVFVHDTP